MSRIGKQLLPIPAGVTMTVVDGVCTVTGPHGVLKLNLQSFVQVSQEDDQVTISVALPENNHQRALWGTTTSLIQNMLEGVSVGYKKALVIKGVGFNWKLAGNTLTVNAGFSHPVLIELPNGITATVEADTLTLSSHDKQQVGQIAAEIRSIRTPEPYKGSGIRYSDEVIHRKVGKKAAGSA